MKARQVIATPEADDDARQIDTWWVAHRSGAPNLFLDELANALELLGMEPGVGKRVANRAILGLHRYLLRATGHHLYFVYSDDLVDLQGTDSPRLVYELCCRRCSHRYGTTGSDILQRRCPSCQDGAPA